MDALLVMHAPEVWMLMLFIFPFVFLPMFFLSRRVTSLVPEGHANTKSIDGLRGVAAAFVALNHAPFILGSLVIMPKVFYISADGASAPVLFGALGVQIFFCITGLLFTGKILSNKPIDWTDFFTKRVRRIVPAYLVAVTVALMVAAWFSWPITQDMGAIVRSLPGIYAFGLLPIPTVNGFDLVKLIGVAWTLAVEWRFYLVLPLLYIAARKNRNLTFALITAFAVSDLCFSNASTWSFFIPGAFCSLIATKKFSINLRVAAGLIALAAVAFIFYRAGEKAVYGLEQWICVSVLFVGLTISRPTILTARTLVAMGSVSYSFYLLHCMILFLVFGITQHYFIDVGSLSIVSFALLAGATLSLSSIIATASYVFIEHRYMHKPASTNSVSQPAVVQPVMP